MKVSQSVSINWWLTETENRAHKNVKEDVGAIQYTSELSVKYS